MKQKVNDTSIKNETTVETETTQEAPSTIKVGDREFSQDELNKLVGLGQIASELETKWNTPIENLNSAFTKTSTELKQIREEQEKAKLLETTTKANAGGELTPEEQERMVKQELSKYGVLTKDEVNTYVEQVISQREAGKTLLNETERVVASAESEGKPKISVEDLLTHMQETGIKSPEKAYKDKFEAELDQLKQEKIKNMKPEGLYTTNTSTAGGKTPQPVTLTKENLSQQLSDFFRSRGQGI